MTEAEWLTTTAPIELVEHLRTKFGSNRKRAGRRKLRLFACACCRCLWSLFKNEPHCVEVIEATERFADGELSAIVVQRLDESLQIPLVSSVVQTLMLAARAVASTDVRFAAVGALEFCAQARAFDVPDSDYLTVMDSQRSWAAAVLRCIFGNPFRPATFDPAWRTSDVLALARGIYDTRAFGRMPILVDALQDAGCNDDGVLSHCRDTAAPHARGCWVVDLVLNKS